MRQSLYQSPLGSLQIISTDKKIASILFSENLEDGIEVAEDSAILKAKQFLDAYFEGKAKPIDFPLVEFTLIQQLLLEIPFGEQKTYKELAQKLNIHPRYAGRLVGQNRLAIVIPCHRIVRSDGGLGGFAWGISTKKALLEHEKGSS